MADQAVSIPQRSRLFYLAESGESVAQCLAGSLFPTLSAAAGAGAEAASTVEEGEHFRSRILPVLTTAQAVEEARHLSIQALQRRGDPSGSSGLVSIGLRTRQRFIKTVPMALSRCFAVRGHAASALSVHFRREGP